MRAVLFFLTLLAACAQPPTQGAQDSVVPGTIGVTVRAERSSVVVDAVAKSGPASRSGVRAGDVVLRFNGEVVTAPRQFYRLVVDSRPGSVVRLELLRDGAPLGIDVPVEQLDTMPRA